MLRLSEEKLRDFMQSFVGKVRPALREHAKPGHPMSGFTDNYIRVVATTGLQCADNTISRVRLGGFAADGECLLALPE